MINVRMRDAEVSNEVYFPGATPVVPSAKKKKVCIVGTAPQWQNAPFDDPEWEIWAILGSSEAKRVTRLYELHDKETVMPIIEKNKGEKYWAMSKALGDKFIVNSNLECFDRTPDATPFDFEAKLKKYGPYFGSSASWIIADAIDYGAISIAIYGINMAADSEYAYQKPSCMYMLGYARAMGIEIIIPDTSELNAVPFQYGYQKPPRVLSILQNKKAEIAAQRDAHAQNEQISKMGKYAAEQCIQLTTWFEQNFK